MLASSARSGKISLLVGTPRCGVRAAEGARPAWLFGRRNAPSLPVGTQASRADRGNFRLDAHLRGSTNLPHANPYRAQWTENGAFLPRGSKPATGGRNTEPFRSGLV